MTPDRTAAAEALTSQPPPGRPPARGRQEGGGDPFGTLLDQHQARTADAEGQVKESRQDSGGQKPASTDHSPQSTDKDKDKGKDAGKDPSAVVAPTAQVPVIAAVPVTPVLAQPADAVSISQVPGKAVQAVAGKQAPAPLAGTPVAAPVQLAATSTAPVVAGPAVPAQPADAPKAAALQGAQVPVAQQPPVAAVPQPPATPVAGKPATPVGPQPAPAVADKAKAQAPATRDLPPATSPHPAAPAEPKQAQQAVDPAPNPNPKQDTPAGAPAPAPAPAPAVAPHQQPPATSPPPPATAAPQAAPPAQPPTAAAPAPGPAAPPPGTRLEQAVETVHQVIRISQSSGITQARVQLHPEELGSIDIHLRSTPDGVVARVVAHAAQAAAVLRDGGDDLRRQLAAQGINLTHFDVGTAGGDQRGAAFGDGGSQQRGNRSPDAGDAGSGAALADDPDETTTVSLPNGVLVDVLA